MLQNHLLFIFIISNKRLFLNSVHYPGTISPEFAKKQGTQLWSSEDYSTFNDNVGGGCWARVSLCVCSNTYRSMEIDQRNIPYM